MWRNEETNIELAILAQRLVRALREHLDSPKEHCQTLRNLRHSRRKMSQAKQKMASHLDDVGKVPGRGLSHHSAVKRSIFGGE